MKLEVRVIVDPVALHFDLQDLAAQAGRGMRDFWASQLEAGKQPDGSPVPLNAKNKPLGKATGRMIRRWKIRRMPKRRSMGRAFVEPFTAGKYAIAVAQLRKRGLVFQSFDGESGETWERVAREISAEALAGALDHGLPREWTDVVAEGADDGDQG
jgi:hypothetical protein